MYTLSKLADGYSSILFPSNTQQGQAIPGPPPRPSLFEPVRFPVCARLQIANPIANGLVLDFPLEMSFLESRPHGKLKTVQGVLRQVNQGSYLMAFNNGAYYIRFCPADASIVDTTPYVPPSTTTQQPVFPPFVNPTTQQNPTTNAPAAANSTNAPNPSLNEALAQEPNDGSNYMILSDTSTFPGCNNYAVFTTDPDYYYRNYDEDVMKFITREKVDSNANPLHFLGCPCGLREK